MIDLAIDDRVFINSRIEAALQELDIMFYTTNTELIGDTQFGTNFEQFSWAITPMISEITNYIEQKISECFYLSKLKTSVDVKYVQGSVRSTYNVDIEIYDNETGLTGKRQYTFS